MMVSNGSMAIGGIVWGALAAFKGLEFTLHTEMRDFIARLVELS